MRFLVLREFSPAQPRFGLPKLEKPGPSGVRRIAYEHRAAAVAVRSIYVWAFGGDPLDFADFAIGAPVKAA